MSAAGDKTIVVQIEERKPHRVRQDDDEHQKFHAHDENNECGVGDTVSIMETPPVQDEALAPRRGHREG
ncbi:MAG: uS17 family ribosomal protein [Slackia sp.]